MFHFEASTKSGAKKPTLCYKGYKLDPNKGQKHGRTWYYCKLGKKGQCGGSVLMENRRRIISETPHQCDQVA